MSESQFEKLSPLGIASGASHLLLNTLNKANEENKQLREENKQLQAIADEVENLHYGTDLFTACGAGAADRLINLIEKEVGNQR
jgi:hypothetical protein